MQTLLSNLFFFLSLSCSSFVHFGKEVVNVVSVRYWCMVDRPRSVCWHKMETKTKKEEKNTDPAQTKETNDNSSCWAAHN